MWLALVAAAIGVWIEHQGRLLATELFFVKITSNFPEITAREERPRKRGPDAVRGMRGAR